MFASRDYITVSNLVIYEAFCVDVVNSIWMKHPLRLKVIHKVLLVQLDKDYNSRGA